MKKELKLGIFAVIIFIVFAYFIIKTDSFMGLFSKKDSYPLYARFSTVSGLFENAPVRLAGVRIGTVQDIRLDNDKALVTLMVEKKYSINSDARAAVATIGFVGENFIEITYKKELKSTSPKILQPGDEIKTDEGFSLEAIADELKAIAPKMQEMLDSVNNIVGDKETRDALKATLLNLQDVSHNLKQISADDGMAGKTFDKIDSTARHLKQTLDSINHFVNNLDKSLFREDQGILHHLNTATGQIKTIAVDLQTIVKKIEQGKGTAGKLITDDGLYKKLDRSASSIQSLLKDIEKSKKNLDQTRWHYYAGIDYLTEDEKAQFNFGLDVDFAHFSLFSRVRENTNYGDTTFTVMAGKRYGHVALAAGMVDSELGAALYLNLFNRKLNLQVEASRFSREGNPVMRTMLSFSLSKNINLNAGYEDVLREESRKFLIGISLGN